MPAIRPNRFIDNAAAEVMAPPRRQAARRRRRAPTPAEENPDAVNGDERDDEGRPLVNGWVWKPQEAAGGFRFQGKRAWLTYSQIGEAANELVDDELIQALSTHGRVASKSRVYGGVISVTNINF